MSYQYNNNSYPVDSYGRPINQPMNMNMNYNMTTTTTTTPVM